MANKMNMNIAVIGGGVIGLMCAWRCAQKGHAVTLFEARTIGSGASAFSLGSLVPYTPTRQHDLAQFQRASLAMYPALAEELLQLTGIDIGYRKCGRLQLFGTEGKRASVAHDLTLDAGQGMLLTSVEIEKKFPHVNRDVAPFGGLLCKYSASVDVVSFLEALQRACLKEGVIILEKTKGYQEDLCHDFDKIVVAAGSWSDEALGNLCTTELRTEAMMGHGVELMLEQPIPPVLVRQSVADVGEVYAVVRPNGNVLLGSDTTRPEDVKDWLPDAEKVARILTCGAEIIPALKNAKVLRVWRAPRPKSCHRARPIRRVDRQVILATGHYKIGYCLAPKVGADILDFMGQT